MTDFNAVIDAWDADGATGGHRIHPLGPDSPDFWALGEQQAQHVRQYTPNGATVLDFGAGIGRLAIPLAKMPFDRVYAVDSSTHMLDGLAERAAAAGVSTGVLHIVHSHGPGLPTITGEGTVDTVVSRAVLIHHDYESVEAIVSVLATVLKPGGHLIADWPTGVPAERADWIGVTRWHPHHRLAVARLAGLEPVDTAAEPTVWRKIKEED